MAERVADAIHEDHQITRQGKQYILYSGLLDAAHKRGLKKVNTDLIQVPDKANGNVAIAKAVVFTEDGEFSGIGDASPDNVGRNIVPHLIRMAETRAKARAFRDAINVGGEVDESGLDSEPVVAQTPAPVEAITNVATTRVAAGAQDAPTVAEFAELSSHQDILADVAKWRNRVAVDHRPDEGDTLAYAAKSVNHAKATLKKMVKLVNLHPKGDTEAQAAKEYLEKIA